MEPLKKEQLKGIWGALQIPFNRDESIDFSSLNDEIDFLTNSTLHGIYSNGTASEFYNQTEQEFDKINETMAVKCHAEHCPFQIGASHMSPILSLERVKRAKSLSPSAFQIIFPDWLVVNPEEQLRFLEKIAEACFPIPIVLYLPGHAKTRLTSSALLDLSSKITQLIGVKIGKVAPESHADIRELGKSTAVFIPGHHLASGMKTGTCVGSYSNVACIDPDAATKWYDIIGQDMDEGLKIEKRILTFFDRYIIPFAKMGYCDAALDKLLRAIGGRHSIGTKVRWPYKSFDQSQVAEIRTAARRELPSFFVTG